MLPIWHQAIIWTNDGLLLTEPWETNSVIFESKYNNLHLSWPQCVNTPDSKVHGANMGPTWVLLAPCWPHEPCYQGPLFHFRKELPTPIEGQQVQNELDRQLRFYRESEMYHIRKDAAKLRESATDINEALAAAETYLAQLGNLAIEVRYYEIKRARTFSLLTPRQNFMINIFNFLMTINDC